LLFPAKYREKILNIPDIFLTFFYKYRDNDAIVLSLLGSTVGTFRFSRNGNLLTSSICHFVQGELTEI